MDFIYFTATADHHEGAPSPVFGWSAGTSTPAVQQEECSSDNNSEVEAEPPKKKKKGKKPQDAEKKQVEHAPNWKPAELKLLLDRVLLNIELRSRELTGNEITNEKRQQKWIEITNTINAMGLNKACSWTKVRKTWQDLKS